VITGSPNPGSPSLSGSSAGETIAAGKIVGGELAGDYAYVDGGCPGNYFVRVSDASEKEAASTKAGFAPPSLSDVVLDAASVDLLKQQSAKLRLAGYTQSLLAWSPLLGLAGESSAIHAAVSISSADWQELADGMTAVRKFALYNLATESLTFSYSRYDPKLKQFWKDMSDFYQREAGK
jgi:hypothetical protein